MAKNVLTQNLSEPLDGSTAANFDISTDTGNVTIDTLTNGEPVLVKGSLQYLENQSVPTWSVTNSTGRTNFSLKATYVKQSLFRLPWAACIAATEWQIHLNPGLPADIKAHSGGGNVRINLSGMDVSRVSADTGGGNMEVILPENVANLEVTAKSGGGNVNVEIGHHTTGKSIIDANSGAGNVSVHLPNSIAARITASSGLGKVIVDPRFIKINESMFQSSDYDIASDKVEVKVNSGAGNVNVSSN